MRLHQVAPDLADSIAKADLSTQRAVALAAAEWALAESSELSPVGWRILSLLREAATVAPSLLASIRAEADRFDRRAWEAKESAPRELAASSANLRAFEAARAATAVIFAAADDPRQAAEETVYEASMIGPEPSKLLDIVRSILKDVPQN